MKRSGFLSYIQIKNLLHHTKNMYEEGFFYIKNTLVPFYNIEKAFLFLGISQKNTNIHLNLHS